MRHAYNFGGGAPSKSSALATELNACYGDVERQLRRSGWASYTLADLPFPPWRLEGFPDFARVALADLPADPYDKTGQRKRRYGRFLWAPSASQLTPIAREIDAVGALVTYFVQGADYQPEMGGRNRKFAALTEPVLTSPVLRALIEADWRVARRAGVLPDSTVYLVGVHIQKLEPQGTSKAVITPNTCHRDGELATFVHLMEIENVVGGWNAVTTLDGVGRHPAELSPAQRLGRLMLTEPGSGFVVDDRKVAHFVEGVSLIDQSQPGHRTTMLIDFCPAKWVLSNDL
jgi:hypothetical protein